MKSINYRANLIPTGRLEVGAQVSQYDVGRIIDVYVRDQGDEYVIPEDAICTLNARKPDKTIYSAILSHTTEYAEIVTSEQLTCVSGKVICELRITSDGTDVGTANFILRVEASPVESGAVSDSLITSIEAYLQTAAEAAADAQVAAESAAASAESAASYAENASASASAVENTAAELVEIVNEVANAANAAATVAQSAYTQANTAYTEATDAANTAASAYTQANSAYALANTANTVAMSAYAQANSAYTLANTANATAASAYSKANSAYTLANTANTLASSAYALASNAATSADVTEAIESAIAATGHASFQIADSVPSASEAEENVLYLVMNSETGYYDIYALVSGAMVLLDDTSVDLSEYVTNSSLASTLSDYVLSSQIATDTEVASMLTEVYEA